MRFPKDEDALLSIWTLCEFIAVVNLSDFFHLEKSNSNRKNLPISKYEKNENMIYIETIILWKHTSPINSNTIDPDSILLESTHIASTRIEPI